MPKDDEKIYSIMQIVLTASKNQHAFLSVHRKIFQVHVTRGNNLDPKYASKSLRS